MPQQSGTALTGQFDVYLTLNFGQQWQPLLDGRICFGLKGAKLQLRLENSEISEIPPTLGDFCHVKAIPSPNHPCWHLNLKPGDSRLRGSLQELKLGTVQVTVEAWELVATLEVSLSDISVANAEGLWRHDISPNKLGIVERALAQYLHQEAFSPYLSWGWLSAAPAARGNFPEAAASPASLSRLQKLIAQLYEAETDNFLELVQLAELNLESDLAGGNFLAANLTGLAVSGADLSRANFRGADLTDTDLSEANLSQAKFGGADLSGAYLGNANLSQADLHRAGLALANLIGADLTGANLAYANLTQANLSGATVVNAKFSENAGLSEEVVLNLKQRGAIFE
jgi:uncharacterized protein YjbI with pentapeptide repeats